jgi:hypothetical protein
LTKMSTDWGPRRPQRQALNDGVFNLHSRNLKLACWNINMA